MIEMQKIIKPKPENKDTDATVKKMLDTWDKIKCHYCGKEISMFNAKPVENGKWLVCREH